MATTHSATLRNRLETLTIPTEVRHMADHVGVSVAMYSRVQAIARAPDRFVAALSGHGLAPTHWRDDPPSVPFDPEEVADYIRETGDDNYSPLRRAAGPAWEGCFWANGVKAVVDPNADRAEWQRVLAWADDLADVVRPAFGAFQPVLPEELATREAWGCGLFNLGELLRNGPPWLGARTYLGRWVADLIGVDRLRAAAARVADLGWGYVVDLINDPAGVSAADHWVRTQAVMAALLPSGVFGDYRGFDPAPGPNWSPIDPYADP